MPTDQIPETERPATLYSLQALRALAALLVVTMHMGYAYEAWMSTVVKPKPDLFSWYNLHIAGASGVHLFFVISGFIIASQRTGVGGQAVLNFAIKRISRVAPLYWLATFAYIAIVGLNLVAIWPHLLTSLLFIPVAGVQPVLSVGWTLEFEMFFYLVFGVVVVALGLRRIFVILFLLATLAINEIAGYRLWALGEPIIVEFAVGMVIFRFYRHPVLQRLGPLLFFAGLGLLASSAYWFVPPSAWGWRTVLAWGGPSALMVLGAASWECRREKLFGWPPVKLVGDASYSLYLIHPLLYFKPWNVFPTILLGIPFMREIDGHVALAILVAITVLIAIAVHLLIERPLIRGSRQLLTRALLGRKPATKRSQTADEPQDSVATR